MQAKTLAFNFDVAKDATPSKGGIFWCHDFVNY